MWIPENTTTAEMLQTTQPAFVASVPGPEAQLMLLQLLTQLKMQNDTFKDNNESSGGEDALRALDVLQEDNKQQALTRTRRLDFPNFGVRYMMDRETCDEQILDREMLLEKKEHEIEELQEKLEEMNGKHTNHLQIILGGKSKENALIDTAKTGNVADMNVILDYGGVDLECEDWTNGWTPLEWAVAFGHTDACRLLLRKGANPEEVVYSYFNYSLRSNNSHWPLLLAARFGHLEIASLLLQYGADTSSNEPELLAKEKGYLKLAQLLCEWRGEKKCHYLVGKTCNQ